MRLFALSHTRHADDSLPPLGLAETSSRSRRKTPDLAETLGGSASHAGSVLFSPRIETRLRPTVVSAARLDPGA